MKLGMQGSGQMVGELPDPGYFRAVAEMAEETGYDSIWAGDHVSFHNPILDVTVALSCFAARTERRSCSCRSGTRRSWPGSSRRSTT